MVDEYRPAVLRGFDIAVADIGDQLHLCHPLLSFESDPKLYVARRLNWQNDRKALAVVDPSEASELGTLLPDAHRQPIASGKAVIAVGTGFVQAADAAGVQLDGSEMADAAGVQLDGSEMADAAGVQLDGSEMADAAGVQLDGSEMAFARVHDAECRISVATPASFAKLKTRLTDEARTAFDEELGYAARRRRHLSERGNAALLLLRRCGPRRRDDLAIRQLAGVRQNREFDLYRRLLMRFSLELGTQENDLEEKVERHIALVARSLRYTTLDPSPGQKYTQENDLDEKVEQHIALPSEKRSFIFRQIDGTPSEPEKLPDRPKKPTELLGADSAVLTTFIKRAWELPGEWHRFPKSSLALRALLNEDARRTPRFEIRNTGKSDGVCGYRCDLARRIIDSTTNGELEHLHEDLSLSKDSRFRGKPGQSALVPDQFALTVFATIVQRPDIVRPPHARTLSISPEAAGNRSTPHEPGSIRLVFSEMMRRIMDHWTGPVAIEWSLRRRFYIASSGSLTFWSLWTGKSVVEIMSKLQIDLLLADSFRVDLLAVAFAAAWVLGLPALHGILVSWIDQQHGPIRLYLSGFLLSYFIWFLLSQTPEL